MAEEESACCSPSRVESDDTAARNGDDDPPVRRSDDGPAPSQTGERMVRLGGESFLMGTDGGEGFPDDGEGPVREVDLNPFDIDMFAVTNVEFLEFVKDTGYRTEAERFGWSYVFADHVLPDGRGAITRRLDSTPWWVAVEGANWFYPRGPGESILDRPDLLKHPVVHVSWDDAREYAHWAGKRLPTEAEWEYAARGGLSQCRFPWGDELTPDGEHRCNIWQGDFPGTNTAEDGYESTAPVNAFRPNGHGLYNSAGNVWEWCADWFSPDHHTGPNWRGNNPTGPPTGTERVMRGGSYLCHRSWCNRYRVAARSKNTPTSSSANIGFRCAKDVEDTTNT